MYTFLILVELDLSLPLTYVSNDAPILPWEEGRLFIFFLIISSTMCIFSFGI